RRRQRCFVEEFRRLEERPQPVEVRHRDRIELVIVALRTAELQPEEHRADRGGHLIEHIVPPFVLQIDVRHVRSAEKKACGDRPLTPNSSARKRGEGSICCRSLDRGEGRTCSPLPCGEWGRSE